MMKTENLIDLLAAGGEPEPGVARRAALWPLLAGILVSGAILLATLGPRTDLPQAGLLPSFWIKLAFCLALAGAGWRAVKRLATPGASVSSLPWLVGGSIFLLWLLAGVALLQADPAARTQLFLGSTWRYCPTLITLMSLPAFGAALHLMRGLAPTRLRLAGAAAGLAAGAMAASVYCLHCPEASLVFVGCWYLLGMVIPAGIGALIGPKVLAW